MSSKPSKQRKAHFTAPLHRRHRSISADLSADLRIKYNRRSIPLRKGDTVQVSRGDYAGTEGKITKIDYKNFRVHVEGATGEKADGTTHLIPIHPSKVSVTKLNIDDKWRKRRLTKKPSEPEAKEEGVKEKAEAAEGVERVEAAEKENAEDIEEKEEEERA